MFNHSSDFFVDMRGRIVLIAVLTTVFGTTAAWSQQAQPQLQVAPSQQAAPPTPPATPPSNPGLVEEIGKLLKDSASGLTSTLPSPGRALEGLNSSAKDATDSLKRLAPPSGQTMASGRTLCPPAANGAPDCKRGADLLCKEKGYAEGRSVDIESTQKCSAKSYFSGQGACRTETFVTRAVCQ
ncbi:MAG: hypothetical protein IJ127_05215 [Afipia sp.]|nr:hypothetical protein [Afipia sp.]